MNNCILPFAFRQQMVTWIKKVKRKKPQNNTQFWLTDKQQQQQQQQIKCCCCASAQILAISTPLWKFCNDLSSSLFIHKQQDSGKNNTPHLALPACSVIRWQFIFIFCFGGTYQYSFHSKKMHNKACVFSWCSLPAAGLFWWASFQFLLCC